MQWNYDCFHKKRLLCTICALISVPAPVSRAIEPVLSENDFDGARLPGFIGSPVEGEALHSPGAVNKLAVTQPPSDFAEIYNIQGADHQSPLVGNSVTTRGIVTVLRMNGFYMQDPEGDGERSDFRRHICVHGKQPKCQRRRRR